jgi:hypothetical protein
VCPAFQLSSYQKEKCRVLLLSEKFGDDLSTNLGEHLFQGIVCPDSGPEFVGHGLAKKWAFCRFST